MKRALLGTSALLGVGIVVNPALAEEPIRISIGGYYDREVDYDIKNLTQSIEPLLLVGIGAMVLVMALGIFLPMWDLASAVRGGR